MKKEKSYYTSVVFASGLFFFLFSVVFVRLIKKSVVIRDGNNFVIGKTRVLSATSEMEETNIEKLPNNFPSDFPINPESVIQSINTEDNSNIESFSVRLVSEKTSQEMLNYYKENLNMLGWELGEVVGYSNSMTFSLGKENVRGFISIINKDDESEISVTLGIEKNDYKI